MRDIFVTLVIFGSLPLIYVRPFVGIIMWCWIAYMVPHRLTWGFAFDYPFAQIVAITTLGSWLLSKERKMLPMNAITILMLLLMAWVSLTSLVAVLPDDGQLKWERTAKIMLITFVTIPLLVGRKRIEALVWVIALSVGFYGIKNGLFMVRGAGSVIMQGPDGGFFEDNNALALTLVMAIPLMRYLQLQTQRLWLRVGLGGAMLLSLVAVIGTQSRGGFLAAATMAVAMILISRRRLVLGTAFAVAVFFGAPYVSDSWVDRMETIQEYEEDSSASGRIDAWTFAWRLALDRPFGGGFLIDRDRELFLRYVPEAVDNRAFHSIYFEVMGEHGFIGLAIFLALMISTFVSANKVRAAARGHPELQWASDLVKMVLICLVSYAVGGLFLNLAFYDLYYHLVVLILCTRLTVEAELKTAAEPRAGPALDPGMAVPRQE